jgi:hypothetical protein
MYINLTVRSGFVGAVFGINRKPNRLLRFQNFETDRPKVIEKTNHETKPMTGLDSFTVLNRTVNTPSPRNATGTQPMHTLSQKSQMCQKGHEVVYLVWWGFLL